MQRQATDSETTALTSIFEDPHEDQDPQLIQMCRDTGPAPACSLVDGSVSVRPHGPKLLDPVGFLLYP